MRKTISIILLSSIIGSTVVSTPMKVIADADNKKTVEEDKKKSPFEEGKEYGEKIGEQEGELKGKKDALDGKPFDWQSSFMSLGNIDDIFNIGRDGEYTNGFKVGFTLGFENGYGQGYMDALVEEVEKDVIEDIAEKMGNQDAISDYYNNLNIDIDRHRLTDEEIREKFILHGGDSEKYEEYFIVAYRTKYEDTYRKKYRQLREENFTIDAKGYNDGKKVGTKQGDFSGKIDFVTPNAHNNWEFSLQKFEAQKSIEERYFLNRETPQYKQSFITGFREAFRIAYNEAYQKANIDIAENNINYVKVANKAESLDFKPSDGVGNLGGKLIIENATFNQETHIGISMDRDSFNYKNLKYKPVNHVYNVAVNNQSGAIEIDRPMTLELEYYGSERAGIYQLVNNEWKYIYTEVSEGLLEAKIPTGLFKGGKYAIFIDEDYQPITDIKGHWAKDELWTFLRRDYIKGDKGLKYYPNANMSRGEFLDLLGKTFGWDYTDMYDNSSKFKDSNEFGNYKNAINYAANMGYISGTPEGNFKAHNAIKYNQVEWILKKVLFNDEFSWDPYAKEIEDKRYTKPQSTIDKNQPIKKGEVVYMLHEIQKKNLM